jgi:signal peptidase complex subunit 1
MDALLDRARDIYEGEIVSPTQPATPQINSLIVPTQDFSGQSLADFLTTFLLVATSILAVIVGFTSQDIYKTLYIGLGGTALTFLLVVPQWPFYNRKPENWLPARVQKASSAKNVDLGGVQIEVDGKRVG